MVGAWGFDAGSGTTTADQSGNGNTGSLSGATWSTTGKYGNALSFNGTNAYVSVPDSNSLDLTTGMTLEGWVRPASGRRMADADRQGTARRPRLRALRQHRPEQAAIPGHGRGHGAPARRDRRRPGRAWTHLAATYDGTTQRLYANGTQVAQLAVSGAITTSTSPLKIGGNAIWGEWFNGLIDEVRVYNRALTPAEITSDMNTPITSPDGIPPSAPGTLSATGGSARPAELGSGDGQRGLVRYNVHRSTTAGFTPSSANRIAQPTGTSYTDTVAAGTYYYKVTAEDALGNIGAASNEASTTVVTDTFAPTAPTSLTAGVAGGTVNLSWSAATDNVGVTRYNLHRGTTSGFTPSVANRIAQPTGIDLRRLWTRDRKLLLQGHRRGRRRQHRPCIQRGYRDRRRRYRPHGARRPCSLRLRQHRQPRLDGRYRQCRRHPLQPPPRHDERLHTVDGKPDRPAHRPELCRPEPASGSYFYKVTAEDAAGNIGPVSNTASGTVLDTTPPTVSITAPVSGATVSATTTLTANASDNGSVGGVQFKLDGANLGAEDTTAPYSISWDTFASSNGPHNLSAVARDGGGNTTTATTVPVTVQNTASAGLVGAWAFDEASGTTAADQSGKGNNGTLTNATWISGGKFNNALSFNGTNAWVTVPDAATLDLTTGMTVEAWVKPGVTGNWRTAVVKEQPGNLVYGIYANTSANRPEAEVFVGGATSSIVGPSALPTGSWSHLAATYDGTTLRLYVDGAQVAQLAVSGSILTSNSPVRIGGNGVWPRVVQRLDRRSAHLQPCALARQRSRRTWPGASRPTRRGRR